MKKYKVTIRFEREFTRIVTAKTEAQAIRTMQQQIHDQKIAIRAKDMDKQTANAISNQNY